MTDLDLWRAPARPCGSAKPAAAEPGLDPDLDVELELGKCRADAKTRGRPPGRRRAWVVAGVAALAACAAAAGWIGLAGGADELAGFAGRPREDQLASAGPAVMDHGEDNTAFPEYIIGLDAWAGLQELDDFHAYLQKQGVAYRNLSVISAVKANLTDALVEELRGGSWAVVQSLEHNAVLRERDEPGSPLLIQDVRAAPRRRLEVTGRRRRSVPGAEEAARAAGARRMAGGAPWHLDYIDGTPDDGIYDRGSCNGAGVDIYVLDTGVRTTHMQFAGNAAGEGIAWRAVDAYSYYGSDGDALGHGTGMASIAAGLQVGVANASRVFDVQVLDGEGTSSTVTAIIEGIEWVSQNVDASRRSVVSMSIGGAFSAAMNNAVQNLILQGVPVIVAAGNAGSNACWSSPGSVRTALTVGSVGRTGQKSSFSNDGSCVEIWAPGEDVEMASHLSNVGLSSTTGTSPATAIAAGVAALALGEQAFATPQDLFDEITRLDGDLPVLQLPTCATTTATSTTATATATTTTATLTTTATATATATTTTATLTTTATTTATATATRTATATGTETSTSPAAAAPIAAVLKRGRGNLYLFGEVLAAAKGDVLEYSVACACISSSCNVDLYAYLWREEEGRWRSVANSRSWSPDESLAIRSGYDESRYYVAGARIVWGWANCSLTSAFSPAA